MQLLADAPGMDQTIVRYQGGGHTFPKNDAGVLGIFGAYLLDLTVPAAGATALQTQAIDTGVLWGLPLPT